jgi:hypothetical protein
VRDATEPADPTVYAKRLPWFVAIRALLSIGIVMSLAVQVIDGSASTLSLVSLSVLFVVTAISLAWDVHQLVQLRRKRAAAAARPPE